MFAARHVPYSARDEADRRRRAESQCFRAECSAVRGSRVQLQLAGDFLNEGPRPLYVPFQGVEITDREPKRIPAVELGMRQENLARGVDLFEQAFVEFVRVLCAEADDAERYRRGSFEIGRGVDPSGEQPRQADVLAEPGSHALGAEMAQHHPQLERAKAPPELN